MKAFVLALCFVAALASPAKHITDVRPRVPVNPNFVPKKMDVKDGKIVGGTEAFANATYHQFPHAAHLFWTPNGFSGFYCTAQIISETYIMTAGHCCDQTNVDNYWLTVGAHNQDVNSFDEDYDSNSKKVIKGIEEVIQHERYYPAVIANDICLLKLKAADQLTYIKDLLQPCLLATDETSVADTVGAQVFPCGWGLTSDSSSTIPDELRFTDDKILSDADCKAIFNIEFAAGEICIDTSDTHQGTCSGDSGGPLNIPNPAFDPTFNPTTQAELADPKAIRWITNGITSYGASAGCEKGYPDAFTDVNFYNGGTSAGVTGENWIRDNSGVGGQ